MKKQKMISVIMSTALLLTGCSSQSIKEGTGTNQDSGQQKESDTVKTSNGDTVQGSVLNIENVLDASEMFTGRDYEVGYEESESTVIRLEDNTVSCDSDAVQTAGSVVTILDEGTYILSGTLKDGSIVVDADKTDKIQLVLDGVQIQSESSAAVYVRQADKVFVTLSADSENTLTNGGQFHAVDENNIDAVIFSKDDLTLNGTGKLTIDSPAGHGIVSKDDLVLTSGTYDITAASHGISGKDSVRISDGNYTIDAGKDGIHAENADDSSLGFVYIGSGDFTVTAGGDGISAGACMQVDNGTYTIQTGGGSENTSKTHDSGWKGNATAPRMPQDGRHAGKMMPSMPGEGNGGGAAPAMPENEGGDVPPVPGNEGNDGAAAPAMPENEGNTGESAPQMPDDSKDIDTGENADTVQADTISTKGVKAAGNLLLKDGKFTIDAADDAFHSNAGLKAAGGNYKISTGDDGFHADAQLVITGGTIDITESYEGVEGQSIDITGGEITLVSSDDGLNAAGGMDQSGFGGRYEKDSFSSGDDYYIHISGGVVRVNASGDGIDSNGSILVSGGETYVSGPSDGGNGALDYETEASVTGGMVIAAGNNGMAQNFGSGSTQGTMLVSFEAQQAGSRIKLTDSSGRELVSWQSEKAFDSVVVSCPQLIEGEVYTLTAGNYETEITMDSLVYGEGGMGGWKGRGQRSVTVQSAVEL